MPSEVGHQHAARARQLLAPRRHVRWESPRPCRSTRGRPSPSSTQWSSRPVRLTNEPCLKRPSRSRMSPPHHAESAGDEPAHHRARLTDEGRLETCSTRSSGHEQPCHDAHDRAEHEKHHDQAEHEKHGDAHDHLESEMSKLRAIRAARFRGQRPRLSGSPPRSRQPFRGRGALRPVSRSAWQLRGRQARDPHP